MSCKPCQDHTNPDCENYVPCLNDEVPVISDFGVGGLLEIAATELHEKIELYLELDTVLTGPIRFWSKNEYPVLKWDIEGHISNEKEIVLNYSSDYHGQEIEATLESYEFIPCLAESAWRSSKTKKVVFRNYTGSDQQNLPIYGFFEGKFDDGTEAFTLLVDPFGVWNLPVNCDSNPLFIKYYDRFFIEGKTGSINCQKMFGAGLLSEDRTELTIDFLFKENGQIVEKVFEGKRL